MPDRRPQLRIVAPAASAEEAAAIVAALERFMRDSAPAPTPGAGEQRSAWARAGLLEATGRVSDAREPWGSQPSRGRSSPAG